MIAGPAAPELIFTGSSPQRIAWALGVLEPTMRIVDRRAGGALRRAFRSPAERKAKLDSPICVTTVLSGGVRGVGTIRTTVTRSTSFSDPMPEPGRAPTLTTGAHRYDLSIGARGSRKVPIMLSIRQFGTIPGTGERRMDHLTLASTILRTVVHALETASIEGRRLDDAGPISHAATERTVGAVGEVPTMDIGHSLNIRTPVVDTAWPSPTASARTGMVDDGWRHCQVGDPMDVGLPSSWNMRVMVFEDTLMVDLEQTVTPFEHDRDPVKAMRGEAMLAAVPAGHDLRTGCR